MMSIKDSIAEVGPGPCPGCQHFDRCRDEQLACTVYTCWLHKDGIKRRRRAKREPSREIYKRAFPA
jgi:hypothetical protein